MKTWMLAVAVLAVAAPVAEAAQVTARLIYATNAPGPNGEKGLQSAEPRLAKAFGWREYQLLSQTSSSLREGGICQLDLGRKLLLRVKLLKETKPAYFMRCQLLRGEAELLQTSVSMTSGSAYFITGPEYDNGQLLISIAIR
ncbi:MAG: hypothetical protein WCV00_02635 [Verrucomicrobiia bacterium]|jgi:hypothetical protein